jgi:hypothetical protein
MDVLVSIKVYYLMVVVAVITLSIEWEEEI